MSFTTTTEFNIKDLKDEGAKDALNYATQAIFGNDPNIVESQAMLINRYADGTHTTTIMSYDRNADIQLRYRSTTIEVEEYTGFKNQLMAALVDPEPELKDVK